MCLLLPVSGPCTNNTLRWYYNYAVGRCQQFTYGGCNGNQNNFETLHNCLQQCGKSFSCGKCLIENTMLFSQNFNNNINVISI